MVKALEKISTINFQLSRKFEAQRVWKKTPNPNLPSTPPNQTQVLELSVSPDIRELCKAQLTSVTNTETDELKANHHHEEIKKSTYTHENVPLSLDEENYHRSHFWAE